MKDKMADISKHRLLELIYQLQLEIEAMGASTVLSNLASTASDVMRIANELIDQWYRERKTLPGTDAQLYADSLRAANFVIEADAILSMTLEIRNLQQRLDGCIASREYAKKLLANALGLEPDIRAIEFFATKTAERIIEFETWGVPPGAGKG